MLAEPDGALPPANRERWSVGAPQRRCGCCKLVNTLLDFSRIEAGRVAGQSTSRSTSPRSPPSWPAIFRSAIERAGLALRRRLPAAAGAGLRRPRHVGEDRPQPALQRLQVHLRGRDRASRSRPRRTAASSSTVRDTGIGIPADELPRLFERFHRVEGARGRTHEGTGIGLALVQELVRLHGGDDRGRERRRARARTFTVALPLGTAHLPADRIRPARARTGRRAARRGLSSRRRCAGCRTGAGATAGVATADRSDAAGGRGDGRASCSPTTTPTCATTCARLLGRRLRGRGGRPTARRRWPRRARAPPDLVLADVMMPRLDGFGLLRGAARRPSARAAIAGDPALGPRRRGSQVEGLRAGADDYLVKPFSRARAAGAGRDAIFSMAGDAPGERRGCSRRGRASSRLLNKVGTAVAGGARSRPGRPGRHRRGHASCRARPSGVLLQRDRRQGRVLHALHPVRRAARGLREVPDAAQHRGVRAHLQRRGHRALGRHHQGSALRQERALSRHAARVICRCAAISRCRWSRAPARCSAGCSSAIRGRACSPSAHERLVVAIAAQAAIAIDNARLYDEAGAWSSAARGRPPQGRVPGDARPRAAQPAGADPQRPASCMRLREAATAARSACAR